MTVMRSSVVQRGTSCSRVLVSSHLTPGCWQLHGARRLFSSTAPRCQETRKWSTPLAKQLHEAITTTGPVPLASYMRMCLTGDLGGYYTGALGQSRDQFGAKGDFITSPEISQVFGELVGIWFVAEWMSQGRPASGVQLIEVGPGRGTLMDDMLRTIHNFPDMLKSISGVHMVETSKELSDAQKHRLCGEQASATTSETGFSSRSKYGDFPVVWTDTIKSVPTETSSTPFIVAHEFFDALPIHTFQTAPASQSPPAGSASGAATADGEIVTGKNPNPSDQQKPKQSPGSEWREMMVAPTMHSASSAGTSNSAEEIPEFQLILSSAPTRHSRYLPETSSRYQVLKGTNDAMIEVCPDASIYTTDFATRIGGSEAQPKPRPSGAALILDYGTSDTVPINSLRGIRHHKLVSPFSSPGLVDLSADVDFTALAESALTASHGVEVHGPINQADFLELMGIQQRAEMLLKAPGMTKEQADKIQGAWRRLVDRGPNGMGKVYKALAILPENDGKRRPVGFGGDIIS